MNEDKATRYHRLGRRASVLSAAWAAVVLSGFLASGASARLSGWATGVAEGSHVIGAALCILVLTIGIDLLTLPFAFYRSFVLERKYGLSAQKVTHWLREHAKAAAIGVLFAQLGGGFVYAALRLSPEWWWAVSAVAYSAVLVLLVNLAPVVLLPIFFRFKPLENAALRDRLTALAARAGTRVMGVYEWTLSDRTKKANAALTGIGNTRRILLSDTLLSDYSEEEIEVILAHELAHHVHRDIRTSMFVDAALALAGFFVAHHVLRASAAWLGLQGQADPAGIPVLVLTAGLLSLCVKPALNALSRAHERRADSYALTLTNNPAAFITAMRRLGQQNLAEDNPSRLARALFYTHPPIRERLAAAHARR